MDKKVHILYVTFNRDHDWLNYSMASIKKYCSGFSGITIVVPIGDVSRFLHFETYSTPECPVLVKNFMEYHGKGFVHHLAMKCHADSFCPTADFILHMDPDCLFHEKVTPDDYFVDGKPVLVIEPYEAVLAVKHYPRYHWKGVTEMALRFDCPYETMCRHPAVHPRAVYGEMRNYIESIHATPFYDFVIKQKNSYPQGFGEFNTLGSYALKFCPERYHFIDIGNSGVQPPSKLTQLWSHTGVTRADNQAEIKRILSA